MDWEDRMYSEADVLVELVHRLKLLGEEVRCEVKLPSSAHRSGFMRCDLVIIREKKIAFAIEVKSALPVFTIKPYEKRRQTRAYHELEYGHGVPVIWVHGMAAIDRAIDLIVPGVQRLFRPLSKVKASVPVESAAHAEVLPNAAKLAAGGH